jgi:outer membrane lipoprotein carrier protein
MQAVTIGRFLTLLLIFTTSVSLSAQTDLRTTLRGVEQRYNRPRSMQMNFEQSVTGQGRMARTESGVLYLRKPGKMRWNYSRPEGKVFLTDGKYVWFYSPNTGRVERSPMKESADLRAPLAFLMGRLDFYRDFREFRMRAEGADTFVVATPKSERAPYTTVEFLIAPDHRIKFLKVVGQDDSVISFRLSEEKSNPPLDEKLFQFKVPTGVEVVEVASEPGT